MNNEVGRKNFFNTLKKRIKKIFKLTSWSGFVKMFFREKHIDWVEYVIEDVDYPNGIISMFLKIRYNTEKEKDMLTNKQIQQMVEAITERVTENISENVASKITDNVVEKITENVASKITDNVVEKITENVVSKITDNVVEKITENVIEKVTENVYKDLEKKIDEKFNSLTKNNKSDDK